jgi:hypothetical protein
LKLTPVARAASRIAPTTVDPAAAVPALSTNMAPLSTAFIPASQH